MKMFVALVLLSGSVLATEINFKDPTVNGESILLQSDLDGVCKFLTTNKKAKALAYELAQQIIGYVPGFGEVAVREENKKEIVGQPWSINAIGAGAVIKKSGKPIGKASHGYVISSLSCEEQE